MYVVVDQVDSGHIIGIWGPFDHEAKALAFIVVHKGELCGADVWEISAPDGAFE